MVPRSTSTLNLSEQAKSVVWRIFGSGMSPHGNKSAFDLIEPIVRRWVPEPEGTSAIAEIRSWFDAHGDNRWLRNDVRDDVAQVILDGVEGEFSERAVWAVGSIDDNRAAPLIRCQWSELRIDAFVTATIDALCETRDRGKLLNVARAAGIPGLDPRRATLPQDAIERDSKLATFVHLDVHGWELVHYALHPTVGNLLELVVDLRTNNFSPMFSQLDHSVLQARAAAYLVPLAVKNDHRAPLRWLSGEPCDALVAAAIKHTLDTVNLLDDEARASSNADPEQHPWRTELRPGRDDLDHAAQDLLESLVNRLAEFPPETSGHWLGELLVNAPDILRGRFDGQKPLRIAQLESACTSCLSRLLGDSPERTLDPFRAALSLGRRRIWNQYIADLAWHLRTVSRTRAVELAKLALDDQLRQVNQALAHERFFFQWQDWHDRENVLAIGRALALSLNPLEISAWVWEQCTLLPLTAWDAEESHSAFLVADRIAHYWFLVAYHALTASSELNLSVDSADIRALAQTVWAHCDFVGRYPRLNSNGDVAAEAFARAAVRFGEATDAWILKQADNPAVGPRSLYALVHERAARTQSGGVSDRLYEDAFTVEFTRAAVVQFEDGGRFDLDTLSYWGELWLLLNAPGPAEQTAIAILNVPTGPGQRDRAKEILTLKLLAIAANDHSLSPALHEYIDAEYSALWRHNTPSDERTHREFVDQCLGRPLTL